MLQFAGNAKCRMCISSREVSFDVWVLLVEPRKLDFAICPDLRRGVLHLQLMVSMLTK